MDPGLPRAGRLFVLLRGLSTKNKEYLYSLTSLDINLFIDYNYYTHLLPLGVLIYISLFVYFKST